MESAFSFDFAGVRVHTGAAAHDAASALGARALTAGTDILFRAGEYQAGTQGGDRLLAHELAHVVQQAHGLPQGILDTGATDHWEKAAGLAADHASPAAEREAQGAAKIAAMGEPVPALSGQPPTIARQDAGTKMSDVGTRPLMEALRKTRGSLRPSQFSPDATSRDKMSAARVIGTAWGEALASDLARLTASDIRATVNDSAMREVDEPGDDDDPTLAATNGRTGCNVPLGLPWIQVTNTRCTAPCTLLHESVHFTDILPCCVKAGIAYRAAGPTGGLAVQAAWNSWLKTNQAYFECRAYRASQACGTAASTLALCWAPEGAVRTVITGASALAGGLVGSALLGGAGAAAGAAAGTAGGPAAPVTVPAGAAAGFITGELLGFLGGATLGFMAGIAIDTARQKCCDDLGPYRSNAATRIAKYCGAPAVAPCPF